MGDVVRWQITKRAAAIGSDKPDYVSIGGPPTPANEGMVEVVRADAYRWSVGHAEMLQAKLDAIVTACDQFEGRAEKSFPAHIRAIATLGK